MLRASQPLAHTVCSTSGVNGYAIVKPFTLGFLLLPEAVNVGGVALSKPANCQSRVIFWVV